MKVLLLGANGLLATDLVNRRPAAAEVVRRSRDQLDIRHADAVDRAIRASRPDWVINCAAYNDVDGAETDRESAFAINATAVGELGRLCAVHGASLLHFSTDYVFDGTLAPNAFYAEGDAPHPLNVYGDSKLAGERALERSEARFLLIRTQWLFGVAGRSFVEHMRLRARARQATRVVADEFGCCTYTVDLAQASWALIAAGARGTLHVANRGRVSRYDLARRTFERLGALDCLTPCTTSEFRSATRRPPNSPLSVGRAEAILGYRMATWDQAVDRYLEERESQSK